MIGKTSWLKWILLLACLLLFTCWIPENEIYDDVFHCEIHVKASETPHNSPRQFPTECTNKMNGHEIYTCNKKKVHPHFHSKWINRGQFLFYWRKIHKGLPIRRRKQGLTPGDTTEKKNRSVIICHQQKRPPASSLGLVTFGIILSSRIC